MEKGYANSIPFRKADAQENDLLAARPRLAVYVEGRGAETLDACIRAFRGRPGELYIAGDLRILGPDSQQDFERAYGRLKTAKIIVVDIVNGERSDRDGFEMRSRAAKAMQYAKAMGGDRKTAKSRGRKGGRTKGKNAAEAREGVLPAENVRRLTYIVQHKLPLTWRLLAWALAPFFSLGSLRRNYRDDPESKPPK